MARRHGGGDRRRGDLPNALLDAFVLRQGRRHSLQVLSHTVCERLRRRCVVIHQAFVNKTKSGRPFPPRAPLCLKLRIRRGCLDITND